MERSKEFEDSFKEAKMVYLITYDEDDGENSRPMTNYSEDPYEQIWFPTDKETQKVKDIKNNPRVKVLVPSKKKGFYYEIEGNAEFEDQEVVNQKWQWWYLSWRPNQRRWFWFPPGLNEDKRTIINIKPTGIKLVDKNV